MKYKVQYFASGPMGETTVITDTESGAIIPQDERNSFYQAYLAWVAEGNTAEEWTPES
jgi:hypothetical protein